jgi:tRNA pseudouridine synthase 10
MSTAVDQVRRTLSESRLAQYGDRSLSAALDIIRILLADSCCSRCCLRFIGCADFRLYAFEDQELYTAFSTLNMESDSALPMEQSLENSICTACLGSIQYADSFVDDVCQKLEKEDYKVDSICLTCTLPVSILPRDHLLKVHVKNVLTSVGQTDLVHVWDDMAIRDPKDFFKYLFGISLKQKTGLFLDTDASLRMTVVIGHEPTSKEHLFLARLREPLLHIKTVRQKVN